ncbi:hypothetical protein P1J78_16140 [Psychromarinibacter sp. C21-152]|uniref:Uncharacterized protein n=1 Tax=Psychromarinibacter sediminicola TaxID=3033385 RepID=A0AAE3NTR2_9RHOB|nr:hypothetical protein [Psychromarinibacter sediminicola]MDF0602271.1 hypothetical protein [Psychromarinibacter sediminicola]
MIAATDFSRYVSLRPAGRRPAQPEPDVDALSRQWRVIYALCRPEELREEEARLTREREILRETTPEDREARRLNRIRRAVLRDRMAELAEG